MNSKFHIPWRYIINTNFAFAILFLLCAMVVTFFWNSQSIDEINLTSTSLNDSYVEEEMKEQMKEQEK